MKVLKLGFFLFSLSISQFAVSDADSEREAEILLTSMGMEEAMTQTMSQMVDFQLQQNPTLAPFKSVIIKFFAKHMSWASLKSEFVKIYSEAFSAKELREINEFYATETGRKTIQLMPSLSAQGGQIGADRVQENIGELQAMIKAESERLQKLSVQ
ncbi:DUF2059 domain-containing protein [Spongiibacter sp. KMU-158]|uniref:DUF2059 domain-containing protein n=1 Tax=Spongiibacter pelagi TaxID=2760804 RepID=A0A927GV58_9GAMM|nr:DUF2059 domain-containing protein [Spongiibacter pelagi]MBD2857718.1 DUF2059 domain-containing protein [Spongiibacter pelagi]